MTLMRYFFIVYCVPRAIGCFSLFSLFPSVRALADTHAPHPSVFLVLLRPRVRSRSLRKIARAATPPSRISWATRSATATKPHREDGASRKQKKKPKRMVWLSRGKDDARRAIVNEEKVYDELSEKACCDGSNGGVGPLEFLRVGVDAGKLGRRSDQRASRDVRGRGRPRVAARRGTHEHAVHCPRGGLVVGETASHTTPFAMVNAVP